MKTAYDIKRLSLMGLLVTIGIVFGDIGTSPLYVMKAIVNLGDADKPDFIIGAVSCVIWTLTLQTTIKYVLIALRADNKGEGGILALFSLIRRPGMRWAAVVAAIGASTLIADGIITPAVTVTSAIEGVRLVQPSTPVVPIVIAIIALIFLLQRSGTSVIGKFFGPVMLVWFAMLGILGVLSIHLFTPVLKAFNPYYAVMLIVKYPEWIPLLGAVFLCTTGAEALYSDLGHCGRRNITVAWLFVKAMLILNYLGQGAWILHFTTAGNEIPDVNPFFAIMPGGFLYFGIALSTAAAIIASQALISGVFTIFSEAMNLELWPRMKIKYPSQLKGQLYIPRANWALFIGCVLTVLMFRSSSNMEAAYGLAITVTMIMTTVLLSLYMHFRGFKIWWTILFAVIFLTIECGFLIANAAKFMHGGWFTVLIGALIFVVMWVWLQSETIRDSYVTYTGMAENIPIINDIKADTQIPKYASNLVYLTRQKASDRVESKLIYSIINKQPKRADHYWILRIHFTDDPATLSYTAEVLSEDTLICVDMYLGFKVKPQVSVYFRQIVEDLVEQRRISLRSTYPSLRRHGIAGDFRFVLIHRVFSSFMSDSAWERTLMKLRELFMRIGVSDITAFGLDTSMVTIETVPLVLRPPSSPRIKPL